VCKFGLATLYIRVSRKPGYDPPEHVSTTN